MYQFGYGVVVRMVVVLFKDRMFDKDHSYKEVAHARRLREKAIDYIETERDAYLFISRKFVEETKFMAGITTIEINFSKDKVHVVDKLGNISADLDKLGLIVNWRDYTVAFKDPIVYED